MSLTIEMCPWTKEHSALGKDLEKGGGGSF